MKKELIQGTCLKINGKWYAGLHMQTGAIYLCDSADRAVLCEQMDTVGVIEALLLAKHLLVTVERVEAERILWVIEPAKES